jgi:hypothetical protein
MTDLAKLGLSVDSSDLEKGTEKLKEFSKSADDAAKSADKFNDSSAQGAKKSADSTKSNAEEIAKAAAKQTGAWDATKAALDGLTARQLGAVAVVGGSLVAATLAAGAAVGVLAYQYSSAQEKIEQSLIGIGRQTGTTIADVNRFATENSSTLGLSIGQARDAGTEFARTGNIAVGSIKGLGDAVYGFSVLTGKNAADSTKEFAKALSGDLVKGANDLDKVYGALDGRTMQYITTLQATGERQLAQQIIVSALGEQNKKASDSVDVLTKSYLYLKNTLAGFADQIGHAGVGEKVQNPLDVASEQNKGQFAATSQAGDFAVSALLPQINAYEKLLALQEALNRAKNSPGAQGLGGFNDAASTVAENQAAAVKESLETSIRYNDRVKEISHSWGDVSQKTSLTLESLSNQLPVVQAVGGAAKMNAQYAADYNNAMNLGARATDAAAEAAGKLQLAQAAAISSVQQQTKSLEQNNVLQKAGYVSTVGMGQLEAAQAQERALANQQRVAGEQAYQRIIDQVGNSSEGIAAAQKASAAAMDQFSVSAQQAADRVRQIKQDSQAAALAWQQTMIGAGTAFGALSGMGLVAGGGGGDVSFHGGSDTAGRLTQKDLGPEVMTQSGSFAAGGSTQAIANGASYRGGGRGKDITLYGAPFTMQQLDPAGISQIVNQAYAQGGIDAAIQALTTGKGRSGDFSAVTSNLNTLYGLKNSQTTNTGIQANNIRQEIETIQANFPDTIARSQLLSQLNQQIQQLTGALNDNTAATKDSSAKNNEPRQTLIQLNIPSKMQADDFIASRAQIQRAFGGRA